MQCGPGAGYGAGAFCWHAVQEHSIAALCAFHWSAAGICNNHPASLVLMCEESKGAFYPCKLRRILLYAGWPWLRMRSGQNLCWLAVVRCRSSNVLGLAVFCGSSKLPRDPSEAEETWSRPMPSKRMPAFTALTGPLENSQKSQLKFRTFGIPQKSQLKNRYFGFSQKSHFKFWRSKIPQKSQMKI